MKKKSKILSLLLAMVMLLSMCAIPVQAADTLQNQAKKVVMVVGQKTTIKTPVKMTFKSSNSKVAAVNSNGKVTAKAKGNATVTAKTSKVTWTYKIKVEKPKLSNTRLSVYTKTSKQLKLKGTSRKVTWSSSAPSVVSVNKKGKITARRTGKATITAKVNGVKYKCKVTVKARSKKSCREVPVNPPESLQDKLPRQVSTVMYGFRLPEVNITAALPAVECTVRAR